MQEARTTEKFKWLRHSIDPVWKIFGRTVGKIWPDGNFPDGRKIFRWTTKIWDGNVLDQTKNRTENFLDGRKFFGRTDGCTVKPSRWARSQKAAVVMRLSGCELVQPRSWATYA